MSAGAARPAEFAEWQRFVKEACGVWLDDTKGYLLETRLGGILRDTGDPGLGELLNRVRAEGSGALRSKVINAITTHETSFFRDGAPFDLLKERLIPDLVARRTRMGLKPVPLRILSAACSTGQEAYSTAITLKETLIDLSAYDIRILGLDISDKAVAHAATGCYSRIELERGLSPERIARHFAAHGSAWRIRDELRSLATFRRANLLEPVMGPLAFDVIFCRNVAIYFTEPDKVRLFRNLGRSLAKDGALIIGSTETLSNLCPEFEAQRHARSVWYRKKE